MRPILSPSVFAPRALRRLSLAAAILSLTATVAGAQAPATKPVAPPAAMSPAATPTPAPPPTPSAAALAAGRELVIGSGISRSFDILIPQFMDRLATSLTQTRPELIRDLNTTLEQLKPEFDKQSDEIINASAAVYARLMTEDQLKQAVAFFKSDAGRRYVESQPAFMTDVMGAMQAWQNKIAANMVERVRQEMRKKGHEL